MTTSLVEIEELVLRGDSDAVVAAYEATPHTAIEAEAAFLLGLAAEEEERFELSRRLLTAALRSQLQLRAQAHLAHLDYYFGEFASGVQRARSVMDTHDRVARAEAHLYLATNLIALNRAIEATSEAQSARNLIQRINPPLLRSNLRFRLARLTVHIAVACGRYIEADSEAEIAMAIARRLGSRRALATAAYLRGITRVARGDKSAAVYLHESLRLLGPTAPGFGRWTLYVLATHLRDLGQGFEAENARIASGIRVPWEEPLFQLATATRADLPALEGAAQDELPFRQATAGVVELAAARPAAAARLFGEATRAFRHYGLEHYRRGAALAAAAAHIDLGARPEAARIVAAESVEIKRHRLCRWPWWSPAIGRAVASLAPGLSSDEEGTGMPESTVDLLSSLGLTERVIETVTLWIGNPNWNRKELAESLGVAESSVRNHLNTARRALDCDSARGPLAIATRIEQLRRDNCDRVIKNG